MAVCLRTRDNMQNYWQEHSKDASEHEMMLDPDAEALGKDEIPEIVEQLPSLQGKRVLELGAGIGRFTGHLAKTAEHVISVDFMQNFVDKSRDLHGHMKNIEFRQADVTQLKLKPESVDFVFSNWLFMYLTDEEVRHLLINILSWLSPGGALFFRESCFHQSGSKERSHNPSRYREPSNYAALLESAMCEGSDKTTYAYEIVNCRPVQTYIKHKNNGNQICWLVDKVKSSSDSFGFKTFQEFLDKKQYSRTGILRYEKIFGRHFVSTGGKQTTEEFVKMLDLQPGQKVLDVGAGIGGSAFYMAENFGAHVLGIDLSTNMINIAFQRMNEITEPWKNMVQFEVCDATKRKFADESFDVIYSRDTILHIADKKSLFENFYRWLKPGGKVLISDYCCKEGEWSEQYAEYVKQRGYILLSPPAYGKVLESAGFCYVEALDRTDLFVACLQREVKYTKSIKDQYIEEFSQKDYDDIVDGWESKLKRCSGKTACDGDQRWGLFLAHKPAK